jgi:hypothetical protein
VKTIADSLKDDKNEEQLPSTEFVDKMRLLSEAQLKIVAHIFNLYYGNKYMKQVGKIILGIIGIITGGTMIAEGISWLIGMV